MTGLAIITASASGAEIDVSKLPPPAASKIDYETEIKPIFEASCFRCHGPEKPKSGFRLDNRQSALKGGANGVAIMPRDSARSPLIHFVARLVEDYEMPPAGKGEPLTNEQIGRLRAWIDQGASWPPEAESPQRATELTVTPLIQGIGVNGDRQKFREDWWQKDGFTAGFERFELRDSVGDKARLKVEGRALYDQNDYRVLLELAQPDLGFVRGGYSTFRKYFDDTGGYYEPFGFGPISLSRDLHLDTSRAWVDLGLNLPNLPKVVVGYEYQFKEGEKSTLQWGQVFQDPTAFFGKAIFPTYKEINEHAHIIKLDLSYDIGGLLVEDNFRAEFYDLQTGRVNQGEYRPGVSFTYPDILARHDESYDHFQAANTFRAEKKLQDWLFLSGGYLYTRLDGDGGFQQEFSSISASFPVTVGDQASQILLEQHSHTVNLNTLLGPWAGFSLSAGAQGEWLRREGLTDLLAPSFAGSVPVATSSSMDKTSATEDVALRYTTIPFTVVFAEARFQQEWIDHFENSLFDDGFDDTSDFTRDTDTTNDTKDYRAGFTVSPWRQVSLEASYRRRDRQNDYDHLLDFDGGQLPFLVSGNGYPAFIRSRDVTGDEVEAKLVLKPAAWLQGTLKYQLRADDYRTVTDSSTNVFAGILYPGGEILAGNQDAHVYSVNLTLKPFRRLYCSTTLSYSDSRIISGVNEDQLIVPYEGDVYSVLSSLNLALDPRTSLQGSYSFSRADYRQDNEASLPLGIQYHRHGLTAGLTRQLSKNLAGRIQYGFFEYREPTAAGANDYTAHAVMASLTVRIP